MDALEIFNRTVAEIEEVVGRVTPAQYADPTPCSDWNVQKVLGHVIEIPQAFAAIANGQIPPEPGSTVVGTEPAADFLTAADAARTAFARPGMLEQRYEFPWGHEPGWRIVRHVANELLIHGWDLAHATGQPAAFSPDLAELSLASWREWFGEYPRSQMNDNFADEQPAPPDASPADRLVAYLGRSLG